MSLMCPWGCCTIFACPSKPRHHFHVEGYATSFEHRVLLPRWKADPGGTAFINLLYAARVHHQKRSRFVRLFSFRFLWTSRFALVFCFVLSRRRSTGWIVLFVPDGRNLVQKGIYCQPSPVFENLYDLPIQASSSRYVTTCCICTTP